MPSPRRLQRSASTVLAAAVACLVFLSPARADIPAPPGGPVLVVTTSDPFSDYYAEILRAEGLNEYDTADIGAVTAGTLASHQVVVLARTPALSDAQATMLENWVQGGGKLIAMKPDPKLASLLGLTASTGTVDNGYLKVDASSAPGAGITGQTMQFHGSADKYTLSGAGAVATLYSDSTTSANAPAVTLRDVGSAGGKAAAFTYDLARSVVETHQGNPNLASVLTDREPDGVKRSDGLFFNDAHGDWLDTSKVTIPQADEQQRLLANLITEMNAARTPLPRLWYFPHGYTAAVVMTGDDHGGNETGDVFDSLADLDPPGCTVADWTCPRATSYLYASTPVGGASGHGLDDYVALGFEIALHLNIGTDDTCVNGAPGDFSSKLATQLSAFAAAKDVPAPTTVRTHCIVWPDWASQPKADLANHIRLNTDYYFYPPSWVDGAGGMFTGSGIPMRFADSDGTVIDVFQAPTEIPDESYADGNAVRAAIDSLLANASGPAGYYGAFTVNMHTDFGPNYAKRLAIIASAQAHHTPIISARQLLTWLDARGNSSFQNLSFANGKLTFTMHVDSQATGLQAMLPLHGPTGTLQSITSNGQAVSFTTRTVKGVDYAVFDATNGAYEAAYGTPSPSSGGSSAGSGASAGGQGTTTGTHPGTTTTRKKTKTKIPTLPRLTVSGRTFRPGHGRTFVLTFRLRTTSRVVVTFRDAHGKIVRQVRVARHLAGTVVRVRWTGRDRAGKYVGAGRYRYTVTAIGAHSKQTASGSVTLLTAR